MVASWRGLTGLEAKVNLRSPAHIPDGTVFSSATFFVGHLFFFAGHFFSPATFSPATFFVRRPFFFRRPPFFAGHPFSPATFFSPHLSVLQATTFFRRHLS